MESHQETGGVELEDEPVAAQAELLERDAELATLEELINGAFGRLLAFEGPPGIGKTSLLRDARIRAQAVGVQVLGARGSELESAFSFGVVRQLFEPLLAQLSEPERAELLAGAAELATPVFEPARLASEPALDASLALLHGLYWLTANVADSRPLLLTIDDLHWCDPPSLRLLAYLLPRMDGLDLSIVVGLRLAEPGEAPALLSRILSDPVSTIIQPMPLSPLAAARLVCERLSRDADADFCAACHAITGGNPLLLQELGDAVVAEEVVPIAINVPRLRQLAGKAGSRTISARLSRLPPEATRLAQAVSILGEDVDSRLAARLAELDDQTASDATVDLMRVDVLRSQPALAFVHPLVRAAVYDTLTPIERDAGHARAARLLIASDAEPEQVATHVLHVSPAAESDVVTVLREAARRAGSTGASESALAYLRRALVEPPAATERPDVLLELGFAEALVSGEAAVEHLQEAHHLIHDPLRRAAAAVALGRQLFYLHRLDESVGVFTRALGELAGADAELERLLESGLISNGIKAPFSVDVSQLLARIRSEPHDDSLGEKMLLALLAFHDAQMCAPAVESVELARRAMSGGTLLAAENGGGAVICACMVFSMADLDEALTLYDASLAEAHLRGSMFAFASAKRFRAQAFLLRGDLAESEADSRDALEAGQAWGLHLFDSFNYLLADALMERGELAAASRALDDAGPANSMPEDTTLSLLRASRARLRMLNGDLAGGLDELLEAGHRFEALGGRNPAFMAWRSQAALALLRLGDRDEARRLAGEELERARTWGAPRALGAALTAAGLAQGGTEGIALVEEAVEVLRDSPAKLEHAKARTELGAALRRTNRRAAAREHLRRALELATICGATPLAARAETELLATGARPRRIALSGVESLTPSERRVAEMAAEGPTNREIAQALFITQRTVEVHLTSVYRKLGISSRSQLAGALAQPARA